MAEKKDIKDFFRMENNKYVCLVTDCKSQIATLKLSALHRHFRQCHESKLPEIIPLIKGSQNLETLRKEILYLCVEQVTVCGRTLNSINDSSFRKLLDYQLKVLKGTPHELTITEINLKLRPMIHEIAAEIREQIRIEFNGKFFSIMFDSATKRNRALLGIDVRTIHSGKIVMRSIGMERIKCKHTGKNIAFMIFDRLSKHGILPKRMTSSTIDNGRNMIKAVEVLDKMVTESSVENFSGESSEESDSENLQSHWIDPEFQIHLIKQAAEEFCTTFKPHVYDMIDCIRCAAHTIQLAVNDALQKSNCVPIIDKARQLVKNIRLQQILLKLEAAGLPIPSLDCITRWFSIYIMVCNIFHFVLIYSRSHMRIHLTYFSS